nr:probable leucine-rich repeat receptor-like protein kinase At1g35710 [Ipomoea batatas]
MTSENNCIIEDVDNEVNFFNPCDFNDNDSFDSSDDEDENCFDTCENNSFNSTENDAIESCEDNFSNSYDSNSSNPRANNFFVSLDDNDGLESFTFGDSSLSNEHVDDLHERLCGDDDMNSDASLCDLIDIEFVNFLDNCLDDALYIHDLLGEVEEETGVYVRDVVLCKEKEGGEESVTIEKENEEENFENKNVLFEEVHCKIIEEEKEEIRDESVREEVEEKMPPRTRSKEQAKKRKQDEGGSSRGGVEGESDLVAPGGRGLGHLNAIQRARVEELQSKAVSRGFYFDFPLLDSYGCREEVERMTSQRYWEHLFSMRDDTYEPVVHEFIATSEPMESSHQCTPSMKFTVFGQQYELSVQQLGIHLGFYTRDDLYTDEYRNLPWDFDSDASLEEYWHRITRGNAGRFIGAKPNTMKILSPALKALKLLLGLTSGGRHKNLHKVYRTDLLRLWSLEMNEPIQMACMVPQWIQTQAQDKCPYIWIDPIVTRLCEGLGLHR